MRCPDSRDTALWEIRTLYSLSNWPCHCATH